MPSPPLPALPCGRFAPSPTGPLHPGSLVAALGSWLMARRAGGQWRVRIEDVDRAREVAGAARAQLAMLRACGLDWDGEVVRQSARDAHYQRALDRLLADGHAFVCHCSRSALAAVGGVHRGPCVATGPRPDPAIRLRVAPGTRIAFDDRLRGRIEQDLWADVGDFVLRRADGLWAYQLAVVVDDADQGVTEVVRGADLLDSTPRQILLQRLLGLPTPRHVHLPLLRDAAGRKLSKSLGAAALDPAEPLPALRAAWHALGQAPLPADALETWRAQALARFDPARIPTDDAPWCVAHWTRSPA
ncbi:tRNA glutamyl-Q(34) synthetase GluQRS [Luteimonas sp. FCS-9]|uniref:tRNA glutamyl-Q(34) synthetase GluQRS n=1 Tax=Luteimonas sp. FCS-9 TaxID=1547516 RepID=UPI00063ECFC4|nr:tRNA glutamyl-Q(34) synthetase GluQRS [Luteimonas sp. FCS-9]KLJ02075.1 glutamyl-Q tRNA(Asp) ligase [Luteimonas sp. FCS-9]